MASTSCSLLIQSTLSSLQSSAAKPKAIHQPTADTTHSKMSSKDSVLNRGALSPRRDLSNMDARIGSLSQKEEKSKNELDDIFAKLKRKAVEEVKEEEEVVEMEVEMEEVVEEVTESPSEVSSKSKPYICTYHTCVHCYSYLCNYRLQEAQSPAVNRSENI